MLYIVSFLWGLHDIGMLSWCIVWIDVCSLPYCTVDMLIRLHMLIKLSWLHISYFKLGYRNTNLPYVVFISNCNHLGEIVGYLIMLSLDLINTAVSFLTLSLIYAVATNQGCLQLISHIWSRLMNSYQLSYTINTY